MLICRICGCSEDLACPGGCAWVDSDLDLCSLCAELPPDDVAVLGELWRRNAASVGYWVTAAAIAVGINWQSLRGRARVLQTLGRLAERSRVVRDGDEDGWMTHAAFHRWLQGNPLAEPNGALPVLGHIDRDGRVQFAEGHHA